MNEKAVHGSRHGSAAHGAHPQAARPLVLWFLICCSLAGAEAPRPGVVVESVRGDGPAHAGGLLVGDTIIAWSRTAGEPCPGGWVDSPQNLARVEYEEASIGPVTLRVRRDGRELEVVLPAGRWGMKVRPWMPGTTLDVYARAQVTLAGSEPLAAAQLLGRLAADAQARDDNVQAQWFLLELARACDTADVEDCLSRAAAELAGAVVDSGEPSLDALTRLAAGHSASEHGRSAAAAAAFRASVAAARMAEAERPLLAYAIVSLAQEVWDDLGRSERLARCAVAIAARRSSASLLEGEALHTLGVVTTDAGAYQLAEHCHRRALAIRERLAPGGVDVARSLNGLGVVAKRQGDLAAAESLYRRALPMVASSPPRLSVLLNNLGVIAMQRGDLAGAEELYRRDLELTEAIAPDSLGLAKTLNNLALVAYSRADMEGAELLLRRSLDIKERLSPRSLSLAQTLDNLADVTHARGDLVSTEAFLRRSLALHREVAPGSELVGVTLASLSELEQERGNLSAAEELLQESLRLCRQAAPGGLEEAQRLRSLGKLARLQGRPERALSLLQDALAIFGRLAPDSWEQAEAWLALGRVLRDEGQLEAATAALSSAAQAIEAQQHRLGGARGELASYRAYYADIYRDLIDLLCTRGHLREAFATLERSRAQALLAMLLERDLVFDRDLPPDLESERRRLAVEYDRAQELLAAGTMEDRGEAALTLRDLRLRQRQLEAQIRAHSPRLAQLTAPHSLGASEARGALDADTTVLAFSVGKDRTWVLALGVDGRLDAATVELSEQGLADRVGRFVRSIGRQGRSGQPSALTLEEGESLYRLLVAPVEPVLDRASRLLVIADGPLYALPFAALVRPTASGQTQYLVEWRPLHVALSATLAVEMAGLRGRTRHDESGPELLAVGDPSLEATASRLQRAGFPAVSPLPGTRTEVEAIAGLWGSRATVLVGAAATEEAVKAVPRSTRFLHLATHGVLSQHAPLDSGLVLAAAATPAAPDNGLLQAWEVLERLRVDADLVVLSGCETALGDEMAGEGLIGLSRAFHYAGARVVVASLWQVADDSTAYLMRSLYAGLSRGEPVDEALRAAQIALIRGTAGEPSGAPPRPEWTSPFHWAAFQVDGDWR